MPTTDVHALPTSSRDTLIRRFAMMRWGVTQQLSRSEVEDALVGRLAFPLPSVLFEHRVPLRHLRPPPRSLDSTALVRAYSRAFTSMCDVASGPAVVGAVAPPRPTFVLPFGTVCLHPCGVHSQPRMPVCTVCLSTASTMSLSDVGSLGGAGSDLGGSASQVGQDPAALAAAVEQLVAKSLM